MSTQEPIVVELQHPIQHGSEEITELRTERRLKAADLRGIAFGANMSADDMMLLVSRLFGQPLSVVKELDVSDLLSTSKVINSFFESGPETGETA